MRPKQQPKARHDDLFRARLDQIINMRHELVVLADKIDWTWLDEQLAESFSDQGRPAEPVRFMIGMFLLKHTYALSDEQVWDRWVQDPYFQYFTGEEFFQHVLPHERSGMSHWRKRIGDKLDILLQESLHIAHDTGALNKRDLARVTVDTTVQPKNVTFPTDAKLLETAIQQLGKLAKRHGVPLRQSYARVAKRAAMMAGRYAHAKQFKRMNREIKRLRIRLGRVIRDIQRKIDGEAELQETQPLSEDGRLDYQIIVNWLIAEHKSQGTMQLLVNRGDLERFWFFAANDSSKLERTRALFQRLGRR